MVMPKIRGGFFIIIFLFSYSVSLAENGKEKFERIIVKRAKEATPGYYSLSFQDTDTLLFSSPVENLSTTLLNLQSRSFNGSIQSDFLLRGSNYEGVRLLLDGKYINDPQTGHHNSDIPFTKEDLSQVELISGVSPEYLGPASIGGAVNFVVKRPDKNKMVFELSAGEHNTFAQLLSISEKINALGVRVSFEKKESKGFNEDTDFKKVTASTSATLDLPLGSFDMDFGYQEKEFGAYDFYTPGKGYPSKEWTKTFLTDLGFKLKNDNISLRPGFLWRRHFDKFMLDKDNIKSNFLSHHRTDVYSPGIYLSKDNTALGNIGLGVEYSHEKINSTTLGKHSRQQESIFIDDELRVNKNISLQSRIRVDDYENIDTAITGAIKATYNFLEGHSFSLGISRAIRIPTFTELYYNDPTTLGSPNLSYEKSLSCEAGHAYNSGRFSFSSVAFVRREDNFVDWVKESPTQAKWQAKNIASSKVFGVEEQLEYRLNKVVNLSANYAYTNRKREDNGYSYKYGENYVRHLAGVISKFNLGFAEQELGFTYKKPPARNGWLIVNARLNFNLKKNYKIFVLAANIFNVEYQEIPGIPSPGRWVEGGLRLEW